MKNPNKTKDDYNRIAVQFSSTRHYVWPEMKEFAEYIKDGQKILDLGCGNGRLLDSLDGKKFDYLGVDQSEKLIEEAKQKHPKNKFQVMKMEDLKLNDAQYDAAFMIASLHHLDKNGRRKTLSETNRILKPSGMLFITVWDLRQPKYEHYIRDNEALIPWRNSAGTVLAERYYHAYTEDELENDLKSVNFKIIKLAKSKWNIYAICLKS